MQAVLRARTWHCHPSRTHPSPHYTWLVWLRTKHALIRELRWVPFRNDCDLAACGLIINRLYSLFEPRAQNDTIFFDDSHKLQSEVYTHTRTWASCQFGAFFELSPPWQNDTSLIKKRQEFSARVFIYFKIVGFLKSAQGQNYTYSTSNIWLNVS